MYTATQSRSHQPLGVTGRISGGPESLRCCRAYLIVTIFSLKDPTGFSSTSTQFNVNFKTSDIAQVHILTSIMATRLSPNLPLLARRGWAGRSSHATPRLVNAARRGLMTSRNTRNIAPWTCRVTQVKAMAMPLRYAHTDAGSSGKPKAVIADATTFKGSSVTEKHWTSQNLPVGTYARTTWCPR